MNHLKRHLLLYLSLIVIMGAFIIPLIFPVYFREDDPQYMMWGISHRWVDAFNPSTGIIFLMFRPIQNLLWWVLYRLFGLNPFPYQVCITLIFGLTLVLFYKLVSMIFSRRAAVFSLIGYAVVFYYVTYVIFWFSDFTYVIELFFVNLSLCFLVRATRGGTVFFLFGTLAYVCAVLAKEPSAIIVPAVIFLFVFSQWNALKSPQKQRAIALSLALGVVGMAWLIFTPGVRGRTGVDFSRGIAAATELFLVRWQYYSRALLSQTGVLLLLSSLYLAGVAAIGRLRQFPSRSKYVLLALSSIVALGLRRMPGLALAVFFLSFIPMVVLRKKEMPAAAWFAIPLLGCLTSRWLMQTYLVEVAFGAAMIVGVAAADLLTESVKLLPDRLPRIARYVLIGVVLISLAGVLAIFLPNVSTRFEALRIVSAARCNLRDAITFVASIPHPHPKPLIVVDYSDQGDDYTDFVASQSELGKAHLQKTMHGFQLDVFMRLISADMPAVHNLRWLETAAERKGLLLLCMNNSENKFIQEIDLQTEFLYETQRGGEKATVYRFDVPAGWSLHKKRPQA